MFIEDGELCELFRSLAADPHPRVRWAVAKQRSIPDSCFCEIIGKLSRDENIGVRRRIAANQSPFAHECMAEIMQRLVVDTDGRARDYARGSYYRWSNER